jgi:hypothetical protein
MNANANEDENDNNNDSYSNSSSNSDSNINSNSTVQTLLTSGRVATWTLRRSASASLSCICLYTALGFLTRI